MEPPEDGTAASGAQRTHIDQPDVALVVHGHRDGNAVGGRHLISDECIARVRAASRAAARHGVTDVLLSGAGAPGGPSEARQMARLWSEINVRLWLDENSTDSAENAKEALAWAQALRARKLVVVSSWWHLRLLVYYRGPRFRDLSVTHVRTRCLRGVVGHLSHELRYLPRAFRSDPTNHGSGGFGGAP